MAESWEDLARQVEAANNRHLLKLIKASYDRFAHEPVPEAFHDLLGRLEAAESRQDSRH